MCLLLSVTTYDETKNHDLGHLAESISNNCHFPFPGDTWASEIGIVSSKSEPFFIIDGRSVPRGTNGGVSLVGLFASFLGGLAIGFSYWLGLFLAGNTVLNESQISSQLPVILLGGISGFLGSLIDSVLGALFQFSGWDEDQKCVVEHKGPNVKHISGIEFLDNHTVNLLSSLGAALITPFVGMLFFL